MTQISKNPSIQSLRGVAALFVVLYHASFYCNRRFGDAGWAAIFDGRLGLAGVAVFFAISGLLMADLIQRTDPWRFLAHRIVRIYPTYLLAVLIMAPITAFVGKYGLSFHGLSLLLIPAGQREYYLGVEWTLVFECTYYVALFLIAAAGWQRHLNAMAVVWLGLIGVASFAMDFGDKLLFPVYLIWLSTANIAFAGGLLIPWAARNMRIPVGTGVVALGTIMVAPLANFTLARWAVGAAAALLVLDATRIKLPQRVMLGLPILGDWSYALYLIHVPCVVVAYSLWPASFGAGAAWLCAVAGALILAAGFGTADVWIYQRLKNVVDALHEKERRRRINIYAGVFVIASLIGAFV